MKLQREGSGGRRAERLRRIVLSSLPRNEREAREPPRSTGSARERARADEEGQATIEAALTLPVVLIALLLIVQVGLVVRDALALVQAAREGARAVAISADDDDARETVRRSAGPLDADSIEIDIEPPGSDRERGTSVTVRLRYSERLRIPIVSRIVALDLPLRASATMRLERATTTPTPDPTSPPTPAPTPSPSPATTPTPTPVP